MTSKSAEDLLVWLRGACAGSLLYLRAVSTPSAASRPRVAKFGAYYAKSYQLWMSDCQKQFAKADTKGLSGPLAAVLEIVSARPKKTKLRAPKGDVDNFAKGALDAATKAGVWVDDGAVEALAVTKRWTNPGEEPGCNLWIGALPT